jgi:hypothetical protein
MPGLRDCPEDEGCFEDWENEQEGEEGRSKWRFVLMFVLISRSVQPLVGKLVEKIHGVDLGVGTWFGKRRLV